MAGYIGGRVAISSPQQIETKHTLTATASQTSIPNIGYTVGAVHVYQNGVRLVDGTDYTATNGSTVTLETGATEGDQIVIVSHGSFETGDVVSKASGGTFAAAMNYPGGAVTGNVTFGDSNKIFMGASSDLSLYHDGSNSYLQDGGTGYLVISSDGPGVRINSDTAEVMADFTPNGAATLYHNNAAKVATTATGITVTGAIATSAGGVALTSLDIDGGTDIGAALVDADLMIVDDGAGGTNRKATMTRLATYMGTKIGGGLEFISSSDASGSANLSFTGFDATKYDSYKFIFHNVIPATDNVFLYMRTSTDGGTNYDSGGSDYQNYNDNRAFMLITSAAAGSAANETGVCGEVTVFAPHLTQYTRVNAAVTFVDTSGVSIPATLVDPYGSFIRLSAADVDAVQFLYSSGNIETGTITMYGIVNS